MWDLFEEKYNNGAKVKHTKLNVYIVFVKNTNLLNGHTYYTTCLSSDTSSKYINTSKCLIDLDSSKDTHIMEVMQRVYLIGGLLLG